MHLNQYFFCKRRFAVCLCHSCFVGLTVYSAPMGFSGTAKKSKKLSQIKLAEIVDMNFNYIGQIERGEANVTIKTMKILANALGVELKSLFDFTF